jgi:hypothetical protein
VKLSNKYPLTKGERVLLIAYPTSASVPATVLQFTYNITTAYYPPGGLDAQLKAEVAEDIDNTNFWLVCAVAFGLLLVIMVTASCVACCKDPAPESDFEKRRRR